MNTDNLNRLHGLSWDTSKRRWKLKLTIDMGSKIVGKRVQFSLPTSDTETAIRHRDAVIRGYEQLGLTVTTRRQARVKPERIDQVLCLPAPSEPEPAIPPADESSPTKWGQLRGRE
jgi:hypothetical protein